MIETKILTKYWHLMNSVIQEFWAITEPEIEEAAVRNDVPIELYLYGELGLNHFSVANFRKRDPFTNPEQFEKVFTRLDVKGWIEPQPADVYKVTEKARVAVKQIVEAGDAKLPSPLSMPEIDLERLKVLIKQLVLANDEAMEPPEKWAILKRFLVARRDSPVMVKIREYLMDLYAYRDDAHLAAARPYFNDAGIVWIVLGAAWAGGAVTAAKLSETLAFRGYEVNDYEIALQAARQIGWLEDAAVEGAFRITEMGIGLREQVEKVTEHYFFTPWSVLTEQELDELFTLLTKLRERLRGFRKSN